MSIKFNHSKLLAFFFSLLLISSFAGAGYASAANDDPATAFGLSDAAKINVSSDKNMALKTVIANVINIALGFLGILAVIIIIYAGFKWMTAGGNDDQVGEAKKMIIQAVIGLVIIFLAWVIVSFAITQLNKSLTE